jgi:hypothetical protein
MHSRRKIHNFTLQGPQNNVRQRDFSCSLRSSPDPIGGSRVAPMYAVCIYIYICYSSPRMMDLLVHHLDPKVQPTNQPNSPPNQPNQPNSPPSQPNSAIVPCYSPHSTILFHFFATATHTFSGFHHVLQLLNHFLLQCLSRF